MDFNHLGIVFARVGKTEHAMDRQFGSASAVIQNGTRQLW